MATGQLSKSELLAAAEAVLLQDDREQAESAQHRRRNRLLTALFVACLVIIGIAPIIASRSNRATPPKPPVVQVQR